MRTVLNRINNSGSESDSSSLKRKIFLGMHNGKRVRKSNPKLSGLRRQKIQFFTKQSLENQDLGYGAPGSDSWINGVVKFLDAPTITADVVTRWMDDEPSLIEATPYRVVTRSRSSSLIKPGSRQEDILKVISKAPSYEPRYPPSWYNFFKSDTVSPASLFMDMPKLEAIEDYPNPLNTEDIWSELEEESNCPELEREDIYQEMKSEDANQQMQPDDQQMFPEDLLQHAFLHALGLQPLGPEDVNEPLGPEDANVNEPLGPENVNQPLGPEHVHRHPPAPIRFDLLRACFYNNNPVLAHEIIRNLEELFKHILNTVEQVSNAVNNRGGRPQGN